MYITLKYCGLLEPAGVMLAAVNQNAAGYEGLQNYIIGGGKPTAVKAFHADARQPAGLPGTALPGAPTPIPTSSAHPGKQTNQRITYARLMTKFPNTDRGGYDTEDLREGDVVFVHRYDGMYSGYDTNKPTSVATVAQLNDLLRDASPTSGNGVGYTTMPAVDPVTGIGNNPSGQSEPVRPTRPATEGEDSELYKAELKRYEAALKTYEDDLSVYTRDHHKYRWRHCSILAEWTPDGICCGTEHEHRADPMVGPANSNPGELYNVAVGGPTLVRNAPNHKPYQGAEQHIDDGMRVLDKVFVGLVCYEKRGKDPEDLGTLDRVTHYVYQYKLFTARQLAWAEFQRSSGYKDGAVYARGDRQVSGGVNSAGPSVGEFHRMVSVWRLGSVLDAKMGMLPYKCANLNVVVEEWDIERVATEYNRFFGASLYLAPVSGSSPTTTELIRRAKSILEDVYETLSSANRDVQNWLNENSIDVAHAEAEVRAWVAVDRAYREESALRAEPESAFEESEVFAESEDADPDEVASEPPLAPPRYEPASGETALLFHFLASREWRDAILGFPYEYFTILGQTAALVDGPLADMDETNSTADDRQVITGADEVHTHYLGVRPVLDLWRQLESLAGVQNVPIDLKKLLDRESEEAE